MIYDRWIRNWKSALAENFFLRSVTLLLAISLVVTTLMLSVKSQRILLVPPQITKEFWIERDRVAPEYMEQMGVFIATLVGNLSPGNAEFNVNMLIKHYLDPAHNNPEVIRELLGQAAYIKKNNMTQAFFPSSISIVDSGNMKVRVEGSNIINIGTARISGEKVSYLIRFNARDYKLYVEEFTIESKEKDRDDTAEENPKRRNRMKYLLLIIASVILFLPLQGHALQKINFSSEGDGGVLKVSRHDINLIKFPIEDVEVYTRSKIAEVKVNKGNVVVAYTTENPQEPIDLLFVTPEGPYSLTLIPADIPSEIIMVEVPKTKNSQAKEHKGDSEEEGPRASSDYVSQVKELLKGMYAEEAPYGYTSKKVNRPVASSPDLLQKMEEVYSGSALTGERYRLTNRSMNTD